MHPYVDVTRYAAENLFQTLHVEGAKLAHLEKQLESATAAFEYHDWDVSTSDLNDDFSDAYVMRASVLRGEAYQAMTTAVQYKQAEEARLKAWIASNEQALDALRAAILQIVKQGIALIYKPAGPGPQNGKWPSNESLLRAKTGRHVGQQELKTVIWQARNQAIHYEDETFSQSVTQCFAQLEQDFGPQFSLTAGAGRSLSKHVFDALGWSDYAVYEKDVLSLLP